MAGSARPRRYAEALFELAKERGALDRWQRDLATAVQRLGDETVLHRLSNPELRAEQAQAALQAVLGGQVAPEVFNLLMLLVRRQQLLYLPRIAAYYEELLNKERHIERAIVRSAVPLTPDEVTALQQRLAQRTHASAVQLDQQVDPSMVGGLIIRIGDILLDSSVNARLATLRHALLGRR